jgi:hypothetical protein
MKNGKEAVLHQVDAARYAPAMRWLALLCILASSPVLLAGCKGRPSRVGDEKWPFWPARMRIHPSTRVVRDDPTGQFVVETRIEFFDADGATARALGQLNMQLHDARPEARNAEPIQLWNQDLRDLAANRKQYDMVYRTYLYRLQIDPATFPAQPELRAYFLGNDGRELEATLRIRH